MRLGSHVIRYKLALYISYLHIKFDYEIKWNPFEFQTYFRSACVQSYTDVQVWLYLHLDFAFAETYNTNVW